MTTAVEWLVDKLMKAEFINNPDELISQAKEMEKLQIRHAYVDGATAFAEGKYEGMDTYCKKQYGLNDSTIENLERRLKNDNRS